MKTKFGLLLSTVLAAALLSPLFSVAAFAKDIAHTPPRDWDQIRENLFIAATDRSDTRFGEILKDNLRYEERSGLIIIGAAEGHEVLSARKFARLLKNRMGLRVVLISSWGLVSVPAYDGVVINKDNHIVANFSMKKVSSTRPDRLWNAARTAFDKIRRFSSLDSWMAVMLNNIGPHEADRPIDIQTVHQAELLFRAYHEVADEVSFFKIGSDRPNWVFVDSDSDYAMVEGELRAFERSITDSISEDPRKAILLHSRGRFYTFSRGRIRLELLSCEDDLKPGH